MSKPSLTLAALIACLAATGCRPMTVVSFGIDGGGKDPGVNHLYVQAQGKSVVALNHLSERIGFYNLSGPEIQITAVACRDNVLALFDDRPHALDSDQITVYLSAAVGPDQDCPVPTNGEIVFKQPDGGLSGDSGTGGTQGGLGSGGGAGQVGAGAAGGSGAGGGGAGGGDAGSDAGNGAGGECDDANHDLDVCVPPTGTPTPQVVSTINPSCTKYCADMLQPLDGGGVLCDGIYADRAQCERYCTLARWPDGSGGIDSNDTIACRERFIGFAKDITMIDSRPAKCAIAGPSGGTNDCAMPCVRYCDAWAGICGGVAASCLASCTPDWADCRVSWLLAAASDSRYCAGLDLASTCAPPACSGAPG